MMWKCVVIPLLLSVCPVVAETLPGVCEEVVSSKTVCFFHPPEGWEVADPSTLSPRVSIAFMKSRKQGFCPSMNLAVEPTSVTLPEYLKIIKSIHESDRENEWRVLGKVHTAAGPAQLTQIDTSSEWGRIRLLQLILIREGTAYVLTAAALKEEFASLYREIQVAFRSLTLSSDLLQPLSHRDKRESLKLKKQLALEKLPLNKPLVELLKEPSWLSFEQEVAAHAPEMGLHWQLLVLKEAQEELLGRFPPETAQAESPTPSPSETCTTSTSS